MFGSLLNGSLYVPIFIDDDQTTMLTILFNRYMNVSGIISNEYQSKLKTRLLLKPNLSVLDGLILRLMNQYPSDNGIFAPIIMNFLKLRKGESFYIGANELHAYISGNCIECMALSDNVVRAGLTPKHKDIATLASMLTYR